MVRRLVLLSATVVLGLAAGACGTSGPVGPGTSSTSSVTSVTSGPVGPGTTTSPGPVVITESTTTATDISVGGTVEVELTSSSYGRDGSLVPWEAPVSDAPGVLVRSGLRSPVACPVDATCSLFVGLGSGTATLSAVGPSGILCTMAKTHCIAVAPVIRRFVVQVAAGQARATG